MYTVSPGTHIAVETSLWSMMVCILTVILSKIDKTLVVDERPDNMHVISLGEGGVGLTLFFRRHLCLFKRQRNGC